MPDVSVSTHQPIPNPLDLIEEIVSANEWPFDRANDDELVAEVPGRWGDYRVYFAWSGDMSALHFSCALDLKVPRHRRGVVNELLALTNERLWLGHFDLSSDEGLPTFRHAVPLRGARGISVEQLEDLVDVALSECERFYPAFQYVVWGGKDPAEAVTAACLDPAGEA
ncbi:MAG: YbjN domain-containing protein [Rhodospirillales bacterium]|nr:YbjN domain-containing protein [Rhodospirillales bacterium]